MPWRDTVFGEKAVCGILLGLCFLSSLIVPSYAQASSFSDMLSSLTPSAASASKGHEEDSILHRSSGKPPIPVRKPAWIAQRAQISSEDLLDADGHWNVIEKGREYDPAQAHLNARKKVNTARRNKMESLSPHFQPDAKSGQDGKLRVLQIGQQDDADYDMDEDDVEVSLLQKMLPVFGNNSPRSPVVEDIVEDESFVVVPKVKPNRVMQNVADVSAGQLDTTLITLVRHDSDVRMVSDVVVPPALPARRKPIQKNVVQDDVAQDDVLVKAKEEGIIPKRKPIRAGALPKVVEVDASPLENDGEAESSVGFVPVPTVKPNIKPVVLGSGRVSKQEVFVKNLRSGVHPDKTRIVIEISDVTEYRVTVDALRNVLRVKLTNTRWNISKQDKLKGSALLGTYIARQQKDNSVLLEIRLKDKAKIVGTMVLRPNLSSSHRIVIDLKAL